MPATITMGYLSLPTLPQFMSEWSAIIPLIVHLASPHDEFQMIGDACLRGEFALDLIPKLGQLKGIAKILRPRSVALDQTSGTGVAGSTTVWDVSWGSVFQCANGAARELVTAHAFRGHSAMVDVETTPPGPSSGVYLSKSGGKYNSMQPEAKAKVPMVLPKNLSFSRSQVLQLVELRSGASQRSSVAPNAYLRHLPSLLTTCRHLVITASIIPLLLCGAYGTSALILCSRFNALINHRLPIDRPPGYLQNNEKYDKAYMLAAPHENSSTWYLYCGDRAIIDWLLNKTMIAVSVPEGSRGFYLYFLCSHYLQLLAMTYVASQKGWDGLFLLMLMIFSSLTGTSATWGLDYFCTSGAATWLRQNNIYIRTASTFRMAGRTQMMGAIQLINDMEQVNLRAQPPNASTGTSESSCSVNSDKTDSCVKWMDTILAVSPRRDAWLQHLRLLAQTQPLGQSLLHTPPTPSTDEISRNADVSNTESGPPKVDSPSLSSFCAPIHEPGLSLPEFKWVEQNALWALETARCIMRITTAANATSMNVITLQTSP